jgi:hypothetical protein
VPRRYHFPKVGRAYLPLRTGRPSHLRYRGSNISARMLNFMRPGIRRGIGGVGKALAKSIFAGLLYFALSENQRLNTGERNGGDDETRTRDLCRDS